MAFTWKCFAIAAGFWTVGAIINPSPIRIAAVVLTTIAAVMSYFVAKGRAKS